MTNPDLVRHGAQSKDDIRRQEVSMHYALFEEKIKALCQEAQTPEERLCLKTHFLSFAIRI